MKKVDEIMLEIDNLKNSRKDTAYIRLNKDIALIVDIVAINDNELEIVIEVRNIANNDVIKVITYDYDTSKEIRNVIEHICNSF